MDTHGDHIHTYLQEAHWQPEGRPLEAILSSSRVRFREIGIGISEASKRVPGFLHAVRGGRLAISYVRQRNYVQALRGSDGPRSTNLDDHQHVIVDVVLTHEFCGNHLGSLSLCLSVSLSNTHAHKRTHTDYLRRREPQLSGRLICVY